MVSISAIGKVLENFRESFIGSAPKTPTPQEFRLDEKVLIIWPTQFNPMDSFYNFMGGFSTPICITAEGNVMSYDGQTSKYKILVKPQPHGLFREESIIEVPASYLSSLEKSVNG